MRIHVAVVVIIAIIALFVLGVGDLHAQQTNPPNCVSSTPSPIVGTPAPPATTSGTILINEVLTNPATPWNCADQKAWHGDSWVELYNTQGQSVDLSAQHPSISIQMSDGTSLTYTPQPVNLIIPAHGFLVFFPLTGTGQQTASPSSISLIINNVAVDTVSLPSSPPLLPDQSYARIPDGRANWQRSNYPTIGASNLLAAPTPTPSPTATPQATKQPRPHRVRDQSAGGIVNSDSNTGTLDNADSAWQNEGLQPPWQTLRLPSGTAPSDLQVTATPSVVAPRQMGDTFSLPKKIMISLSILAILVALFWAWRRFSTT